MHALVRGSRLVLGKAEVLPGYGGYVARHYAKQIEDYNITWKRPEKIPSIRPEKSGDGGIQLDIKPTDLASKYNLSQELKDFLTYICDYPWCSNVRTNLVQWNKNGNTLISTNEIVKRMFSLQFQPQNEMFKLRHEKILDMVKRHKLDWGSAEVKIASMTSEILYLQEYMETHRKNKKTKHFLKELIEKRNKHLDFLRNWDYKKYEWLLEKLNIVFKKTPEDKELVTRKRSLKTLTQKYCDNFKQEKLDMYKATLQKQHLSFYKEKAEKLAHIRSVQLGYGVTPTVTEEEIDETLRKVEELSAQKSAK